MKKIGIITFHNAHNYGAMLQAFALQEKVKNMNYNVEIINYRNPKFEEGYKVANWKKINAKQYIKNIIKSTVLRKQYYGRYNAFKQFERDKFKLSEVYESEENLLANPPMYDVYIAGSDQIWNTNIVGRLSDAYTLNFKTYDGIKISYAASIGNSNIDEKYTDEFKKKIEKIDYISVREENAKHELQKIIEKNVNVVLDPTLLLSKEHWENIINKSLNKNRIKEKYILVYIFKEKPEYIEMVNYLSEKTGYKIVQFNIKSKYKNTLCSAYESGPIEFIDLIKNAEYVCTDSFHGTVFSIIFNKAFFVFPFESTISRFNNLLGKLNLLDRIISSKSEFEKIDFNKKIDYIEVNELLEEERKKSVLFLENAIEDKNRSSYEQK